MTDANALTKDVRAANLAAEEIGKAQLALMDAFSLLKSISVGADDGELSLQDHTDAVHELIVARRALRHAARIINGHADNLEPLVVAGDRSAQAQEAKQDGGAS
ncbi:hypothetical protein [Nonomuraea sp. GTA35]|uniref:hypothetical protein n=1 Tax=Nonomuraea sp. GTA35 TaxID=1676746 RepID=UPI0035C1C040